MAGKKVRDRLNGAAHPKSILPLAIVTNGRWGLGRGGCPKQPRQPPEGYEIHDAANHEAEEGLEVTPPCVPQSEDAPHHSLIRYFGIDALIRQTGQPG